MTAVIVISVLTCVCMIAVVLLKPTVRLGKFTLGLYWVAALLGAAALLIGGFITGSEAGAGLIADTAVNPLKILVLFLSMTVLSVFLDEIGFFKYLAVVTLRRAKSSQMRIFLYLYAIVSVLTVFTSNDVIVLTFTPFICYFCKNAKISPVPYLVTEFIAANTWSMLLLVGNPTNIYLATSFGIGFIEYLKVMALPAVLGGLTSFAILFLLFRRALSVPVEPVTEEIHIQDKPLLFIGLIHLIGCIVLLVLSSYFAMEIWLITLASAASLFVCALVYKAVRHSAPRELYRCVKRAPWDLIPFVLSMFIIVLALEKFEITAALQGLFASQTAAVWTYGAASTLIANLINNIPMSVLFCGILNGLEGAALSSALYASVIGSNLGALLTPVGALAGIMWMGLLKTYDIRFSFAAFTKYGVLVALPTLAAALGGLQLALLWS